MKKQRGQIYEYNSITNTIYPIMDDVQQSQEMDLDMSSVEEKMVKRSSSEEEVNSHVGTVAFL